MKICIFAESLKFDNKVFKTLCSRIFQECFGITVEYVEHSFDPNGHGQLEQQAPGMIDFYAKTNPNLDIIFVFRDSDELTYKKRKSKVKKLLKEKVKNFSLDSIIIGVPQRNVEAWLLSDIDCINQILDKELPKFVKAENIPDPYQEFHNIWKLTDKSHPKSYLAQSIVESFDILKICKKSKSFHAFHEDIRQKVHEIDPTVRHRGHILI